MRKKLAVGAGLIAFALTIMVSLFLALTEPPYEPPLRVGMTPKEVRETIKRPHNFGDSFAMFHDFERGSIFMFLDEEYHVGPDCWGKNLLLIVHFQEDDFPTSSDAKKVASWEVQRLPRSRPPWLDNALKWVGW